MIDRYARAEMKKIWSLESRYQAWLDVEIQVDEAWTKLGVIPASDMEKIRAHASFDTKRCLELEKETRHDVVAFTRCVSESLGPERKWIHYGVTSTDIVDTANGLLFQRADAILEKDIEAFMAILKTNALQYKDTMMIGRTHGIHAEVTTLGLKFALWYEEMKRNQQRFADARAMVECGKISGAVGTFANIPPQVQDEVCQALGLHSAAISTQVLQRDRHAQYFAVLALIGTTLEQMATEIRHLQRTEVHEVEEHFSAGQKGSSAMPHKRNPIGCENICGCARVLRGYMVSAYEDVALWHERDISHSSVERILAPDATELLDYMLNRFGRILKNLTVFPEQMQKNMERTHGLIYSEQVMLSLIRAGMSREEAYDLVQPIAMKAYENEADFRRLIQENPRIQEKISAGEIEACFDPRRQLGNVDAIYRRVGLLS